ncbi:hypothetical protein Y032_0273g979 [Ancylostoma ceylanicum]|uniref:CUB domain-containing protein n=2 Tax=Ancylostoma ceylanicum TaxID=53326 RepID=A0A016S807_9BILA|nr:hypothetical protein Y032_0273g979 [Ancylostoma ceylanicum]
MKLFKRMLQSPEKTRIKIRLEDLRFNATAGCTNNGIEINVKKDKTLTGYRFCYTNFEEVVLSPRFNIAPIIAYSRIKDTGTAIISYRYVKTSKDDEQQD